MDIQLNSMDYKLSVIVDYLEKQTELLQEIRNMLYDLQIQTQLLKDIRDFFYDLDGDGPKQITEVKVE